MRKLRSFPFVLVLIVLAQCAFSVQAADSTVDNPKAKLFALSATQFEEPLVATATTTPEEDAALLTALSHTPVTADADYQQLKGFLASHPHSGLTTAPTPTPTVTEAASRTPRTTPPPPSPVTPTTAWGKGSGAVAPP
jgi:hypothetical protein